MRRLLTLGAGAAIVGIILLIFAFAVSYVVVTGLQQELANSLSGAGTSTVSLTYATLEAVFLAVMIALGYGLITKGLDGVRREEQMERGEVWVEPLFSQPTPAAAATEAPTASPQPAKPKTARPSTVTRLRTSPSRAIQTSRPVQLLQTGQLQPQQVTTTEPKTTAPPPPPTPVVVVVQAPAPSAGPPQANVVEVQRAPVEEAQPASEEAVIVEEPPKLELAPQPVEEPPTVTTPLMEPTRPVSDVKWEGGEPEMPEGIEILPEPQPHGAEATVEQAEPPEMAAPIEQEEPPEAAAPVEEVEPPEAVAPVEQVEPPEATAPVEHVEPPEMAVPAEPVEPPVEIPPPPTPVQAEATTEAPAPPAAPPTEAVTSEEATEKERARQRRQARRVRKQAAQSSPSQ